MNALAPMQHFRDVTVVPIRKVTGHIAKGGPIWPDFERQTEARHCRDGRPVDKVPTALPATRHMTEPTVWGGVLDVHFGHLIGEQISRLAQSLRDRPQDIFLFGLTPGYSQTSLPKWIFQILDWFGVTRMQFVDHPMQVADLRVAAQAEMLGSRSPSAAYLDLLDRNADRNRLEPFLSDVLFVTRAGLVARGMGGHAAEGYLAQVAAAAGVRVIDPATLDVVDQLSVYAGAKYLIFSEGSAIYGRLLLGRIDQEIHVLRRRPNRDLAAEHLNPRCRAVTYHAAARQRLWARKENGGLRVDQNAALFDLKVIFALFRDLGYDLSPHWDPQAYAAAVQSDAVAWMRNCPTSPQQRDANLATLKKAGFDLGRATASEGP